MSFCGHSDVFVRESEAPAANRRSLGQVGAVGAVGHLVEPGDNLAAVELPDLPVRNTQAPQREGHPRPLQDQVGYRDDVDAVRPAVGRLLARKNHEERGRPLYHVNEAIEEVEPFSLRKLDRFC